jgi:hypothetical protein
MFEFKSHQTYDKCTTFNLVAQQRAASEMQPHGFLSAAKAIASRDPGQLSEG